MTWLLLSPLILLVAVMGLLVLSTRLALMNDPLPITSVPSEGVEQITHDRFGSIRHWAKIVGIALAIVIAMTLVLLVLVWAGGSGAIKYTYAFFCVLLAYNLARSFRRRTLRIAAALVTLGVTTVWFFAPTWPLADLLTVGLLVTAVLYFQPRVSFATAAVVMLLLAGLYDAIQVFATGNMLKFASATLVKPMPDAITVPTQLTLNAPAAMLIGLGDIVIPGILVVIAGRLGQRVGSRLPYVAALVGYGIGLVAAFVAVVLFASAQPALIYLVPAVSLAVVLAVWRLGCWRELTRRAYDLTVPTAEEDKLEEAAE